MVRFHKLLENQAFRSSRDLFCHFANVPQGSETFLSQGNYSMLSVMMTSRLYPLLAFSLTLGILGADRPARSSAQEPPNASEKEPRHRVDRDGVPLPTGAVARMGSARLRHGGASALVFTPDGKTLASAGVDVCLWNVSTGLEVRHFQGHGTYVCCGAFAPDGKTLAWACRDGTVCLWDVDSGQELRRIKGHDSPVNAIAYSPDGRTLASGSNDQTIRLWDIASGKQIQQCNGHKKEVRSIAFAPDGKTLVSGSEDQTIILWDRVTGKAVRSFLGHDGDILSVAFSPDGKTFISGAGDRRVRFWEIATGKPIGQFEGRHQVFALSRDGKVVATGGLDDGIHVIELWDTRTLKRRCQFKGHRDGVHSLVFSPDGTILASTGQDLDYLIRLWDTAKGTEIRPPAVHHYSLSAITFSSSGTRLMTGSFETIHVWDPVTGREIRRFQGDPGRHIKTIEASPNDQNLAVGGDGGAIHLWSVDTGQEVRPFERQKDTVFSLLFVAGGKHLISGGIDNPIRRWDVATGKMLSQFQGHGVRVCRMAASPDGQTFALVDSGYAIKVYRWDGAAAAKELHLLKGHRGMVHDITFSPDGATLASAGSDNTVRLWSLATGKELRAFRGHERDVQAIRFSPDTRMLASGSHDQTLRLWEVATGNERLLFRGHRGSVTCLAFAPNGKTLASGSEDATALIWDVTGFIRDGRWQGTSLLATELESLWTDLAGRDARRGYRAIQLLTTAPEQTIRICRERLQPVTQTRLRQLIADLDSDQFLVREQAHEELAALDEFVESSLRQVLTKNPSLELRRRIDRLLAKLDQGFPHPQHLRTLRAIEVLESIGSPQSQEVLRVLAQGAVEARVTKGAKAALDRLAAAK